jgi:vitamin B12/bleomycin/antimicrobial peptide transport system ATP-binding/permease protein
VVTICSFVVILWGLSAEAPLHLFGVDVSIPGYLIWAALIYSAIGTVLTHLIGWPLVGLNFRQQRLEADFRFNLVRTRENGEQIALLKGEPAEHRRLSQRFALVVTNFTDTMNRTKKLTAFTFSYSQAAVVFPFIMAAPAYFAGKVQLGSVMQTASAFGSVQESMSYFISAYRTLAQWQSVVARLDGFEHAIANGQALVTKPDVIHTAATTDGTIALSDLTVALPNGTPLLQTADFAFRKDERTLLKGPSGSGKSTLFRAIAGIWPFGKGKVTLPANASIMMLPQRPYFPIGTLKDAITYPGDKDTFDAAAITEAINAVGLPALTERLDEDAHWNRMLSLGEQQRLGVARALLHRPDYLFLDEATASLDEPSEAAIYRLIEQRLPNTTVISIGHRGTLHAFHQRDVVLEKSGHGFALKDAQPAAAN